MHVAPGPPVDEDEWHAALASLLHRLVRSSPSEALADFIRLYRDMEFGNWYARAALGALALRWRIHDLRSLLWSSRLECLNPPAVRAVSPGRPGRPDDAVVQVPAAPLVRAHAILTAAPPCSRAPVLAGAAPA